MVHPTCAPARPPNVPPAGENTPHKTGADRAVQAKQAAAELRALQEAYRAAACVHDLLLQLQSSSRDACHISPIEVGALVALVNAEFERRMQAVKATVALMQVPCKTSDSVAQASK